jgi:hypothetical protein
MSYFLIIQSFENSQNSVFWLYFGCQLEHERMVCQSGANGRLTFSDLRALQNRRHFGSKYHVRRQNAQNTVFCKLIIIVYFNYTLYYIIHKIYSVVFVGTDIFRIGSSVENWARRLNFIFSYQLQRTMG